MKSFDDLVQEGISLSYTDAHKWKSLSGQKVAGLSWDDRSRFLKNAEKMDRRNINAALDKYSLKSAHGMRQLDPQSKWERTVLQFLRNKL
jgi:hypothetical protein